MAIRLRWGGRAALAERAEAQRQRWVDSRQAMARYLASKAWYDKRARAFVIWRCLGWAATAGPLAAFWFFPAHLYGEARLLLAWPVQDFALFGGLYAASVRLIAAGRNRRLKRVGHHLGYQHVDTLAEANGIDNPEWPGCRERWYEIVPVTQAVNRAESLLRRDRPSAPRKKRWLARKLIPWAKPPRSHYWSYLRRTLLAVALVRFWWVWVAIGGSVYWWGFTPTLGWLEQVGHRF